MPRLVALEWNDQEARVAVAWRRAGRVVIEHAFAVALPGPSHPVDTPAAEPASARPAPADEVPTRIAQHLAAALVARRVGHVAALVAVSRSSVELRQMSLPAAADDDLPDLVRFQALREFSTLGDDWPLDFVLLDEGAGAPVTGRNVLAAALDPAVVAQSEQVCRGAGLKLKRLLLRPCGAASLLARWETARRFRVRLLIDVLVDEADLTVMVEHRVIFMRTARLPGDPLTNPDAAQALIAEVRRTVMAAQNQLGGSRVEAMFLCGSGLSHGQLAQAMADALAIPVELFDPFDGLAVEGDLARSLPDHPGRFAPLLGMLLDELEAKPQPLDFLHPRRRPQPPSRLYQWIATVAAALVLAFGGTAALSLELGRLATEIKGLENESAALEPKLREAARVQVAAKELAAWADSDVVWLDELRRLSERFPPSNEAMLVQLQMLSGSGGREISMEGLARNVQTVQTLEQGLQDATHRVISKGKSEDTTRSPYTLRFRSTLVIAREKRP